MSERDSLALADYTYSPETARRCRMVLLANAGWSDEMIADQVGETAETVTRWRTRFAAEGIAGLIGRPPTRSATGGPRHRTDPAAIIRTSFEQSGEAESRSRTAREIAEQANVSVSTVVRAWRRYGVAPHPAGGWTFSVQPQLVATSVELVGVYASPQVRVAALVIGAADVLDGDGRPLWSSVAGSTSTARSAEAVQSLSKSEPVSQQLADFMREICRFRLGLHLVTDSRSVFARWRSVSPGTTAVHLAVDARSWLRLMEVWTWMHGADTWGDRPLGDRLHDLHSSGGRCRWIARPVAVLRSPSRARGNQQVTARGM